MIKKLLAMLGVMMLAGALSSALTTQTMAVQFGHHKSLEGRVSDTRFYWPWSWWQWRGRVSEARTLKYGDSVHLHGFTALTALLFLLFFVKGKGQN